MKSSADAHSIRATHEAFKATKRDLPPSGVWANPATNCDGFYQAAEEALWLPSGIKLLPASQRLGFDARISVRYVVGGRGENDSVFHALLFAGEGFEALVWIQRDPEGRRLIWRGDHEAFLKAETFLKMFEGETLAHLRS